MSKDHDEIRMLLGAHVLGGLSPVERRVVEDHLRTCEVCRAEAAEFAPLPGLLGRTAPSDVDALDAVALLSEPRPEVRARLLRAARRGGHPRSPIARRQLAAVAAAIALAAGGVGWALGRTVTATQADGIRPTNSAPAWATVALTSATGRSGEAQLEPKGWGTAVHLSIAGLPSDGPLRLEVIGASDTTQFAATWGPTANGSATVVGATSLRPEQIRMVRVVDAAGRKVAATPGA